MRENPPKIRHGYDPRHFAKNVENGMVLQIYTRIELNLEPSPLKKDEEMEKFDQYLKSIDRMRKRQREQKIVPCCKICCETPKNGRQIQYPTYLNLIFSGPGRILLQQISSIHRNWNWV